MSENAVKTVGIVSLSAGTLGESFVSHELKIGLQRMEELGVAVKFLPHALMGREYVTAHPEKRAEDLLSAIADPEIDLILCAIGGEDTYRLLPYLFGAGELEAAVANAPREKLFLGFSDSTVNHLMLHRAGMRTFYGQSFLADHCDIGPDMLPYTRAYLEELLHSGRIARVTPSPLWYEGRTDYSPEAVGTPLTAHPNPGFLLLQGKPVFSGKILGGCLDTLYDLFFNERFSDTETLSTRYGLFPPAEDWRGRILLLETSEEQMPPEKYEKALLALKKAGVFSAVNGILCGKPMDGKYDAEYREILCRVAADPALPIVWNLSVGHALPRCILPFGREARVDAVRQEIVFAE